MYVGGGDSHIFKYHDNDYIIMEYDINAGEWAKLPPYRAHNFGPQPTGISEWTCVSCWVYGELSGENGHTLIQICPQHDHAVLQLHTMNG